MHEMILIFYNSAIRHINHRKFLAIIPIFLMTMIMMTPSLTNGQPVEEGRFVAGLTGNQETQPVQTNATGSASFLPILGGKILYKLNVTDVQNVTKS